MGLTVRTPVEAFIRELGELSRRVARLERPPAGILVGTTNIADDAITAAKIATDAVGPLELAADAVTVEGLADDAVTSPAIADAAILAAHVSTLPSGTWGTVPGGANWVSNDVTTVPRYRKEASGTVFLDGALRNVAGFSFAGTNINIFTLPAGFRPSQTQVLCVIDVDPTNGPRPICVQINTDGNGYLVNAGAAGVTGAVASVIELSGIVFSTV